MKINLIPPSGVRGPDGQDLQPEGNPHDVPDQFGAEIVASGRAVEVVDVKGPAVVRHSDPVAESRDPVPQAAPRTRRR